MYSTLVFRLLYLHAKVGDRQRDYKLYINSIQIHMVNILGIYSELIDFSQLFLNMVSA